MSDIFLNYDDVRLLFSGLSKLNHANEPVTMACISAAVGLPDDELFPRLKLPAPELPGINLDTSAISNLIAYARTNDLSQLRNTDRLNGFCDAFGWKPDAMMHFLKSTTAKLGRNPSLLPGWSNFNEIWINDQEKETWLRQFDKGTGLYIIVGPPGHGLSQTMRETVSQLTASRPAFDPAPIPVYDDFDGEPPSAKAIEEFDHRLKGNSLLYGPALDDSSIRMALHFARTEIVVVFIHAPSSHMALHLVRRAGEDAVQYVRVLMAVRRFFEPAKPPELPLPLRSYSARAIVEPQTVPEHTYWPTPMQAHQFPIATAIIGLAADNLITAERASELIGALAPNNLPPEKLILVGEEYELRKPR